MSTVIDIVEITRYKKLAEEIIKLAAKDILLLPESNENRIDAEKFLESEWFYEIADLIDIDPKSFRDKLYRKQKTKKAAIA